MPVSDKRLTTVSNFNYEDAFEFFVLEPKVLKTTKKSKWKAMEHTINWKEFGKLEKLCFYEQASDMICHEVVTSAKT